MTREPVHLLDPEYVIPSPEYKERAEFWDRMLGQATDRTARLGPATLEALQDLALSPPPPSAVAERDFWRILTQYMSRGFVPPDATRPMCRTHIDEHYQPVLGDPDNVSRLLADATTYGGRVPLVLSSLAEVWRQDFPPCAACDESLLVRAFGEADQLSISRAWRTSFLAAHANDIDQLRSFAPQMFPVVRFHDSAWTHLNSLEGDGHENVAKLVHHLGVLNDHAVEVWAQHTEPIDRQNALGSLGVTASPEGSNTRRSAKKMRLRDFAFGSSVVRCEWHTKLRPNVNRIHFAVDGARIYVGTIVHHLPV